MNKVLTKTHVLQSAKNGQLLQKTTSTTGLNSSLIRHLKSNTRQKGNKCLKTTYWWQLSDASLPCITPRHSHTKICTTALFVSLLATCQPSYAIASFNQNLNNHSFNCVDTVAVTGNNDRQEPKKLPVAVSHHTIVDVFLCLSFASLPFTGELRLALALVRLWWGGSGNKPFIGRIPLAVLQRFLSLPAALHLGQIITTTPLRKVL